MGGIQRLFLTSRASSRHATGSNDGLLEDGSRDRDDVMLEHIACLTSALKLLRVFFFLEFESSIIRRRY